VSTLAAQKLLKAFFRGAYDAVVYLLQLGHRRIGFITGALETGCAQERLAGYKAACKDHSVPDDPQLICEGHFLQPQGYQCARQLLALSDPPTAIFASNDMMAFGVMEAARERIAFARESLGDWF
jgi:LacI family transcriptional regulator